MEQTIKKKICDQPGCKILEGGSCLEGIDVVTAECPHFIHRELSNSTTEAPNSTSITKPFVLKKKTAVQLFTGRELSFNQISLIADCYDNRLIAIIGESGSGKTTLLAEFFTSFQRGAFCTYLFAGSYTQIGFEERAFHATLASGNLKPKTERTKSKEFSFLHLSIKRDDQLSAPASHLLFSDISGETIRDAKTSTILMRSLKTLKSADFILFLIDGEKLANLSTRSLAIEDAKMFIQKAIDENIFDNKTILKVAISKWDFLSDDSSFDWQTKIEHPFRQRFEKALGLLEFTRIAARSENPKIPAAYGICDLLNGWLSYDFSEELLLKEEVQKSSRVFHNYTIPA